MAASNIIDKPQHSVEVHELTAVLVRHFGIHEGKHALAVNYRIAVGQVPGPGGAVPVPGAMMGIEGIGIKAVPDDAEGPGVVDAAVVNPRTGVKSKPPRPAKKIPTSK